MAIIKEFTRGHIHKQETFTKKEVLAGLIEDKRNKDNSSFTLIEERISLQTCNEGKTFSVSRFDKGKEYFLTMFDTYRQIASFEELAALVANFSEEKLLDFPVDEDYRLRKFVSMLDTNQKDTLIYEMLKKQQKEMEKNNPLEPKNHTRFSQRKENES